MTKVGLVREGEGASLHCNITAKPPVSEVGWTLDGRPFSSKSSGMEHQFTNRTIFPPVSCFVFLMQDILKEK